MSKQHIQVIAAARDRESLRPVLAALEEKRVSSAYTGSTPDPKGLILVALSANLYADEAARLQVLELVATGAKHILPLRLDAAPIEPSLKAALYALNIISTEGRTPGQLADRIISALPRRRWLPAVLAAAALVLVIAAGAFLLRSPEETPAVQEPAATAAPVFPAGLTAEDLEKVKYVTILGGSFYWSEDADPANAGLEHYAYSSFDDEGLHWYSCENGHEIETARWGDLSFLSLLPNLTGIDIACAEVGALPDLAQLPRFRYVTLSVCTLPDLDWLAGSSLGRFSADSINISDYSVLNSCEKLWSVTIFTGPTVTDLSSLAPAGLQELTLYAYDGGITDLSGLSVSSKLKTVRITGTNITNLDFLAGKTALEQLFLENVYPLADISGLQNLPRLTDLQISDCPHLRDAAPLGSLTQLKSLHIFGCELLRDFSCLSELPALSNLSLYAGRLENLNFLEGLADNAGYFSLSVSNVEDVSALSFIKHYSRLDFGCDYGQANEVLAALQGGTVNELHLNGAQGIDLSALPTVKVALGLDGSNLEDLSALPALEITRLELSNMQNLRSLAGLENLPNFVAHRLFTLNITGCPRLADWSALEGKDLNAFSLRNAFAVPDFASFKTQSLELENIADVTDLSFLAGLDRSVQYNPLCLRGFEEVRDLSPLQGINIHCLQIPPQLAEQAEELVRAGTVNFYEVVYPEGGWDNDYELTLFSLEELDTLPDALLRHVTSLCLAGDELFSRDTQEMNEEWSWDSKKQESVMTPMLYNRETGEQHPVQRGSVTDFSRLSKLTGLRQLTLVNQPLQSLEGIQALENLEYLDLMCCPALTDVSAAFALPQLRELCFRGCPVTSVQGVQNLRQLVRLDIFHCPVEDLSPLALLDYSTAERDGGFNLDLDERLATEDLSALSAVPCFNYLNINNIPSALWAPYVADAPVSHFCSCGGFDNDADFAAFVQAHPGLIDLRVPWCEVLTDLTPVLALGELEVLQVSPTMEDALASLEGCSYSFRLECD